MADRRQARDDPAVFAALADPTRRSLLAALRVRPMAVGALARRMPVSRPAVSQHLKVLREAGLVREDRRGTRHYFSLNPAGFGELRAYAEAMWKDGLASFARYVAAREGESDGS